MLADKSSSIIYTQKKSTGMQNLSKYPKLRLFANGITLSEFRNDRYMLQKPSPSDLHATSMRPKLITYLRG